MTSKNGHKILIIDDDDNIREMYVELFKQHGFEVIEAHDGIEGLDKAMSESGIEVIFSGINMPRMDGFQMIESLKKDEATVNIPVFINSHLGREEDRSKAMELGARGFIVSGTTPLKEVVKKILHELGEKTYLLKVDPYEHSGQQLIEDLNLPDDLICDNCNASIVLKLSFKNDHDLSAKLICPSCYKRF